jgi:putative salt-induced outer membrane protein YdiY
MLKKYIEFALQFIVLYGLIVTSAYAAKTDIVVLINGNAVTGEIKSLEFGALRYSTDSMGTVNIDWEDIVNLTSNQNLQIELVDGSRYYGHLTTPDDRFSVIIKTASNETSFPMTDIVRITPIETADKFWQRLEGSFTLGLQTQKSSEVTTSNVAADISYRTRDYLVGLRLTSTVTDQPSEETSARQQIQTNYQRFRANRWFTDWFTGWEKNDELGINARVSAGGALGRYFVQTNKNQFSVTLGAQAARSAFIGEDESTTDVEGRIEIRYLHRKLTPETSFIFTSKIFPLLEDLSTYRAESDLKLNYEFVKDLFFEVGVGHSYTSDPPTGASSSDYVVTTSLGYSF